MDKLKTMRTFVQVVRDKSFGEAGARLGISTSLVSKHVAELEKSLGVRLLSRTTRHFEITDIGQRYYDVCVGILRDIDAVDESVRDMHLSAGGKITVRASHSLVVLFLGRLVSDFSAKFPAVDVELIVDEDPAHAVLEAQRGLDVAFHVGRVESDGIACRELATVSWQVYGSKDYVKCHGAPQSPDDLKKHNCLVHRTASPGSIWEFIDGPEPIRVRVNGTIRSNSFIALREATEQGIGLAMLPSFCISPFGARSPLVQVLPNHTIATRQLQMLVSPDRRRPQRIRRFIDFSLKWFDKPPWGRSG